MAKFVFIALAGLIVWLLQEKIETLQAKNKLKDTQIANLQQIADKQQDAMASLLEQSRKQEEQLLLLEKQRRELETQTKAKRQALVQNTDEEAKAWRKQKIPQAILEILIKQKQQVSQPHESVIFLAVQNISSKEA
ncbi:hypothetical protein JBF11_07485 [Taurinivorans muris]|uniref:Uncharacterized protein n=1 Tax=Taurinivorans muris TaxID=2787751 RepID=A0ABY5XZT9_9BACT|nr:hypothetical protein JBF11_07485 [Desulfovibrionaceae bacterium LT0009]